MTSAVCVTELSPCFGSTFEHRELKAWFLSKSDGSDRIVEVVAGSNIERISRSPAYVVTEGFVRGDRGFWPEILRQLSTSTV